MAEPWEKSWPLAQWLSALNWFEQVTGSNSALSEYAFFSFPTKHSAWVLKLFGGLARFKFGWSIIRALTNTSYFNACQSTSYDQSSSWLLFSFHRRISSYFNSWRSPFGRSPLGFCFHFAAEAWREGKPTAHFSPEIDCSVFCNWSN